MSITCYGEMVATELNINKYLNKVWSPLHGLKSPVTVQKHVRPLWAPGSGGIIEALRSCKLMLKTSAAVATAEGFYKSDTQLGM